jgi:serine/threonine protein kinase/GTPase SAR1 family protein
MNQGVAPLAERLANLRSPEKCPEVVVFTGDGISDDQAASIAEVLKISKSIVKLWLDSNSIKDRGAKELGDALKSNTSIQYLNISGNQISFLGAKEIFKGLKVNRTLLALDFNQNSVVCDDEAEKTQREFWIGLQFNKCIQLLSLADNGMTDQTLQLLCKGIASNRSLNTLNLAGNAFTGNNMAATLLPALSSPSLTSVDLSNNPWVPEVLTTISSALKANPSITELKLLRLPSVSLQGTEYNHFLEDLKTNTSILSLNLAETPFSMNIPDLIATNTTITRLNVRGSLIRNDELSAIAKALSTNGTLTDLVLSDTLARQDAIQAFCGTLKTHPSLLHLTFAGNNIGDAASELSDMIRKNKVLKSINIDGSKELTRVGKKILLFSLAANTPLLSFSMCDVPLEAELAPEILKVLKANTHLEEFYLRHNGIYSKATPPDQYEPLLMHFTSSPSLIRLEADIPDPTGRLVVKNLEGRSLTEFPAALLKMTNLQLLNLANNFIPSIPAAISNLVELRDLDISNNRLLTLPPALGFLHNLKSLKLANNAFRTPPPEVLSKNNVKLVLGYLRDLAKGAEPVYRIKLMMVGQENVGKTTILRHIKRRRLRRAVKKGPIKPTISTDGIDVDEWQLEVPFDDDKDVTLTTGSGSASSSPVITAAALMAQQQNHSSSGHSAGGTGSTSSSGSSGGNNPLGLSPAALATTSLGHSVSAGASGATYGGAPANVRHLTRGSAGAASNFSQRSSTDPEANKKFVTVSSWDFAGQEIYYTTHQFFLSQRSLYILVWDLRYEDEECKVSYWLQSIRSRTNNSPVIIVGTHADEMPSIEEANAKAEKVRKKYQKRFPFIKYSVAVSAKTGSDIDSLVAKIRDVIRVQDHTGELIPKTYVEMERLVRSECQAVKEGKASYPPIRSWTEIQTLGSYCHINDDDELRRCVHLLHDFGSLIYFDDPSLGVQDLVIIDSQFLTNVMATIITTKTSIRDGMMPHSLIPMIWRPPEFPVEIHEILLSLLKKFEIAYTLPPALRAKFGSRAKSTNFGNVSMNASHLASHGVLLPNTGTTTPPVMVGTGSASSLPVLSTLGSESSPPNSHGRTSLTMLPLLGSDANDLGSASASASASVTPTSGMTPAHSPRLSVGLGAPLSFPTTQLLSPAALPNLMSGTALANGATSSLPAAASLLAPSGANASGGAAPGGSSLSVGTAPLLHPTTSSSNLPTFMLPPASLAPPPILSSGGSQSSSSAGNGTAGASLPAPAVFTLPAAVSLNAPSSSGSSLANSASALPAANPLILSMSSVGSSSPSQTHSTPGGGASSLESSSASVPSSPHLSSPLSASLLPPAQLLLPPSGSVGISPLNSAQSTSPNAGGNTTPHHQTTMPSLQLPVSAATPGAITPSISIPMSEEAQLETLIPSLLPEDRPDCDLVWRPMDPGKTQFDRRYQLEFVPKGLFSRLMIRILHHADSVLVYWRNGLIAEKGRDLFFMELRPHEAVLIVSARGPRSNPPTDTFRMCVETVDMLIGLNNWFNIKVTKYVPCSHCVEAAKEESQVWMFKLADLEERAVDGQWLVECEANPNDRKQLHLTHLVPDMALTDLERSKIPHEDLSMQEEIGKGAFGLIKRALYRNQEVAVKVMLGAAQEGAKQKAFNEFRREVHVMSGMRHPNLVNMIGFCVNPFALVMELLPAGNLYKFLQQHREQDIGWPLRLKIALDVALGMNYLHSASPPFIHRDLKSPNVLLLSTDFHSPQCAKVGDFGLSSRMYVPAYKEKSADRDIGNPTWLAPEIIREEEFNVSSDVYSYGIILWELLVRKHPFSEYEYQFMFELEDLIKRGSRPSIPAGTPVEYANLITQCVSSEPEERPPFYDIIKLIISMAADLAPELYIPEDIFSKLSAAPVENANQMSNEAAEVPLNGHFIKQLTTQPMHKIYSLALVGENQMWCGTREGSILIWNTKNGQLLARHDAIHKNAIVSVFVAGNYIWTHAHGEKARVWKTLDEAAVQTILDAKETVIEGWLTHKTTGLTKKLKRRFFTVSSKRLYIYKAEGDKVPVVMVDLEGAKCVIDAKAKNPTFSVQPKSSREKHVVICAKDRQELLDWVAGLEAEINRQEQRFDISLVTEVDCTDMQCFVVIDDLVWGGSKEMRLKVWDPDRFQLLKNVQLDVVSLLPASESSSSLFISAITDFDSRIWLGVSKHLVCLDKESLLPIRCLSQHTQVINAVAGYEGRIWTASDDCTVRVWDAFSYECFQTFSEVGGKQFALIRAGPQVWAAGWDGIIRVFNGKTAQLLRALELKHQDAIKAFAPSFGAVWAGSWDGTVSIWT